MEYSIHLENFDGPLDLLLHLVKETKLDIYEIKMSEIIESYLSYMKTLQSLNIDIGSEFLVMASSLIHLKSKMLIGSTVEEETSEEYNIQSEEDLRNRILDYERYKNITSELKLLEEKRGQIYTKFPENLNEYQAVVTLFNDNGLTPEDLMKALREVELRKRYLEPTETRITKRELSVPDRVKYIHNILKEKKKCNFFELFEYGTKDYIVVTFLAILEMCKDGSITLSQQGNFDSLYVEGVS